MRHDRPIFITDYRVTRLSTLARVRQFKPIQGSSSQLKAIFIPFFPASDLSRSVTRHCGAARESLAGQTGSNRVKPLALAQVSLGRTFWKSTHPRPNHVSFKYLYRNEGAIVGGLS